MRKIPFFVALFACSLGSQAQRPMQTTDLFDLTRISDPQLSPDGKVAIFGAKHYNVEQNTGWNIIYKLEWFNEKATPEMLVPQAYNAVQARFTPDGKRVGFLSAQSGTMQLWEIALTGGAAEQITQDPDGISLFLYSPKGDQLLVAKSVKIDQRANELYPQFKESNARIIDELFYRHWDSWDDYSYNHLFLVDYRKNSAAVSMKDLLEGERFDAPTDPFGGVEEIAWSPDGTKIAYTAKKLNGTLAATSTNTDIYEYDIATGVTTNRSLGNLGYDRNPSYSPNGSKLAWLSMETAGYEADKNRLIELDLATNTQKDLTANFRNTVDNFVWSAKGDKIFFTVTEEGTHQVYEWVFKTNSARKITDGWHDYTSIAATISGNNDLLLATKMSASMPSTLYKVNMAGKETRLEFLNRDVLSKFKMGKVEKRMIKAADGKEILTWVIFPPDFDPAKKYPTLLYCQGGPQSAVSQFFSYRWNFQLMAAKGYIVVAPNRRGLPGFGKEWNDEIKGDYGGKAMQDLLSAIDKVAEEPYVDKNRLAAVGASFGGYSVYWLAGNHNKRFKAFIAHCGMFNMESWYGSTEEMFFANYDNGPYWEEDNKENYLKNSPHRFVDRWDTPLLIIHNEKDYRVPLSEGMQAFTAAQMRGIPSRMLYFPDENHWVTKPQNSLLWQQVFFEWLDKYVK